MKLINIWIAVTLITAVIALTTALHALAIAEQQYPPIGTPGWAVDEMGAMQGFPE